MNFEKWQKSVLIDLLLDNGEAEGIANTSKYSSFSEGPSVAETRRI